ncbi:pyridine nucleotide disulfide oxidoreductase-like protein [Sparassis crispa]|uniref:L-2-hydroxyglutarate dehydrogenase, mitochondrial n=1 Tax=Sparassis crispa TaxID=139825 RepID=A0A401GBS1_9APHY|nr:pyridine nucleotide disulfide oxidoreductase-like protein [Sparassis crispa]GBE79597.1 pyridine nucleotide disulfide oxidoreductase-like protein [Sparassis crispa]
MQVRGLAAALNSSGKYKIKNPEYAVDYLVIGGGVVGLAVARNLTRRFPSKSTFLVERHSTAGEESSSRNSEVIHAGLYYPPDSLKTRLCLRGRRLMYEYCHEHSIPHKKMGKLVVARDNQRSYIQNLHTKAGKLAWPPHSPADHEETVLPTKLISGDEARQLESDLSEDITAALWSPETGIVDSHALMENLENDIADAEGGELVYRTSVVRVDPYSEGWLVQMVTGDGEGDAIVARTLINCSGLSAHLVLNALLPAESRIPMYYGRGSYASYRGPGVEHVSHLIYPCPDATSHAFQSLGTHLTLDMEGKIRFGPDLDWLNPNEHATGESADPDFWLKLLIPSDSKLKLMYQAVQEYLPHVGFNGFQPDYCGGLSGGIRRRAEE